MSSYSVGNYFYDFINLPKVISSIYFIRYFLTSTLIFNIFYNYYLILKRIISKQLHTNNIYLITLNKDKCDYSRKKVDMNYIKKLVDIDNESNVDKYILLEYVLTDTSEYKDGILDGYYLMLVKVNDMNMYILKDYITNFEYYLNKFILNSDKMTFGDLYLEYNVVLSNSNKVDISRFVNKLLGPDKLYHNYLNFENNKLKLKDLWNVYCLYTNNLELMDNKSNDMIIVNGADVVDFDCIGKYYRCDDFI
jgi:hypothetical protein